MTTSTFSVPVDNGTQANFQAWGSGLSAALAAVGLTKTADTGQINWSTVGAPVGAQAVQGYEMWQFTDALAGTYPILIKIEYGSSTAATTPSIWVTVGKTSDGAGNITGLQLLGRTQMAQSARDVNSYSCFVCFAQSALVFSMWPGRSSGGAGPHLVVERSRSATNVPNGNAVLVHAASYATAQGGVWQVAKYAGPNWSMSYAPPYILPGLVGGSTIGNTTSFSPDGGVSAPVIPLPAICPGVPMWQSIAELAVAPGDGQSSTFTATVNGAAHTYRVFAAAGNGGSGTLAYNAANLGQITSNTAPSAFLWE